MKQSVDTTLSEEGQPLLSTTFDALQLLRSRPNGVVDTSFQYDQSILKQAHHIRGILFPWMFSYRLWWTLTALGAIFTLFLVPFQIAFSNEPGNFNNIMNNLEDLLTAVFVIDIFISFNLAFYKQEVLIFERPLIVKEYVLGGKFFVDLLGVFPCERVALWLAGWLNDEARGGDPTTLLMFSLFRLFAFVRLYRMKQLSYVLQYDARVSLLWFTLMRNFGAVWALTHLEACSMYFLARLRDFDQDTWLGPRVHEMTGFQRYITALYLVR
jgi:potassium voltage-gated channel Eag-related subfamily H protein 1/potassium voltage-gated channel Eag-related subfamily H protein 5